MLEGTESGAWGNQARTQGPNIQIQVVNAKIYDARYEESVFLKLELALAPSCILSSLYLSILGGFYETGSHYAVQSSLALTLQPRLTLNL